MLYVGNAFSLQMVQDCDIAVRSVTADDAKQAIYKDLPAVQFCIGHADTARMAAKALNEAKADYDWAAFTEEGCFHRVNVTLKKGDVLYVMQVVGGRLPEGCTELPEGIQLVWKKVVLIG